MDTLLSVHDDSQTGDKVGHELIVGFYTGHENVTIFLPNGDTREAIESYMRTIEMRPLGDGMCAYLKSWLLVGYEGKGNETRCVYKLVWGPSELGMALGGGRNNQLESKQVYPPADMISDDVKGPVA